MSYIRSNDVHPTSERIPCPASVAAVLRSVARVDGLMLVTLAAITLLLYVYPLSLGVPLMDPDEGLHASISQEMVEQNSFVMPRLLGRSFYDKPILFFWIQAASLKLFGEHEAAVRVPGLLFGLLVAVTTGLLGWTLFGRWVGVLAACFQSTLLLPLAESQAGGPDVVLVVWTNLALLFLWRADRGTSWNRRIRNAAAAGLCLGLAILTKGLAGPAIVYVAFVTSLLVCKRLRREALVIIFMSGIVGLAVAAPWYVLVERLHPGYLHYYFVDRHLHGYFGGRQRHGSAVSWYYLPVIAGGSMPWGLYLAGAMTRGNQATRETDSSHAHTLLWIWLASGVLFLSAGSAKLATYALPLFPAIGLLAALPWSEALKRPDARPSKALQRILDGHAAIVGILPFVVMVTIERRYQLGFAAHAWFAAAVLALCGLAARAPWARRQGAVALGAVSMLTTLMFLFGVAVVFPRVATIASSRDLAMYLNTAGTLPEHLWIVDDRGGSVVFYLRPTLRRSLAPGQFESISTPCVRERLRNSSGRSALVAVRERRFSSFDALVPASGLPYARAGQFRLFTSELLPQPPFQFVGAWEFDRWRCSNPLIGGDVR